MIKIPANSNFKAIMFMILNCWVASSMSAIAKFVGDEISVFLLLACYNLIAGIIIFAIIRAKKLSLKTTKLKWHITRTILNMFAYYLFYTSLKLTSIANVITISYTDPILTCLFAYLILKERMNKMQIAELFFGFIGALLIIKPLHAEMDFGSLLVVGATTLWGFSNIVMKILGESENEIVQIFFVTIFTTILASILFFFEGSSVVITPKLIGLLLIMGIAACIQYFTIYQALTLAPAGVTMPFFFVNLVFAQIYGYFFFNETQEVNELIGCFLILLINAIQLWLMCWKKPTA